MTAATHPEAPRARRLEELFDAALDLSSEGRAAYLSEACGEDAALRRELEAMLAVDAAAEGELSNKGAEEPRFIGRFEVLRRIGSGGMGIVYLGRDVRLDRSVAIKLLRGTHSSRALLRLEREAQAMARVAHPNVVPIYEVIDVEELGVAVVMEFVDGVTASQWLNAQQRSWREVVELFTEASRGLSAAHDAGIVHRDFKADNVLVGHDGRVRVVDFGLARSANVAEAAADDISLAKPLKLVLTEHGTLVGTPTHMSPEQFRGDEVGAASDQFALAVALYRGVYGAPPFPGTDLASIRSQVLGGEIPVPPLNLAPKALAAAIVKGLAPSAADRWPSVAAFGAELLRVVRGNPEHDLSRAAHVRRLVMLAVLPCGLISSLAASAATAEAGLTRSELVIHAVAAALILALLTFALRKRLLITAIDRRLALFLNAIFWAFALHRALSIPIGNTVTEIFVSEGIMLALGAFSGALAIAQWLGWVTLLATAYSVVASFWPLVAGHGFNILLTLTTMICVHFWGRERFATAKPLLG